MASIRVKINSAAAQRFLNSAPIQAELHRRAENVASACRSSSGKPGYEADVQEGRTRAHAMVKTTDVPAAIDNARNATLLRNFDRAAS